jgi:tetratricopeptide (TPR) repeat protein
MRARIESNAPRGGPPVWLAATVWLIAGQIAWAQAPASPPEAEPTASSLGLRAGEEVSTERIQALYRRILADWSAGQVDQAPDELIELESTVVDDGEPKTRKALFQAEQAVIHEVAANDLEVLVPIAMLHHECYRRYLERGNYEHPQAMVHTRTMARDLGILYWEQSGSEGAGLVASRLLTSLAGMLQQNAQHLPAAELFQQAVALDGRNAAAFLGLATIYEKSSQYESTVKMLRQLLAVDAKHSEGRLRLGVNLRRVPNAAEAEEAEARKLLEELAAGEASWIGPLAVQELARLHVDAKRAPEAEKALRAGLERFPDDIRLHIQLAAVLDRRGAQAEATALVEKALSVPPSKEASSRYLYNTVRREAFTEARSLLDESSRSRLSILAQALSGAPAQQQPVGVGR